MEVLMMDIRTKRMIFKIILLVLLCVLPFVIFFVRHSLTSKQLTNDAGWQIDSIPVPEDVTGAFLLHACLSNDNSLLVVTGRPPVTSKQFSEHVLPITGIIDDNDQEFIQLTSQKIYICNYPPKNADDYRLIVEHPGFSQIVACSISPDKNTLVYLSHEFSWNNEERYSAFPLLNTKNSFKQRSANDVLYIISLDDGAPKPLVVVQNYQEINAGIIHPFSLCWNEKGDTIYCYDQKSLYRIFLNGEISLIKKFSQSVIISNLKCMNNELCYVIYQTGLAHGGDSIFVRLNVDGTIIEEKKLSLSREMFVPLSGSNCSPIIIGQNDIMLHTTTRGNVFMSLPLKSLSNNIVHGIQNDNEIEYSYALCQFFSDDKKFLVVKYADTTATSIEDNMFLGIDYTHKIIKQLETKKLPLTQLFVVTIQ
jgi:hypothetical protein